MVVATVWLLWRGGRQYPHSFTYRFPELLLRGASFTVRTAEIAVVDVESDELLSEG
jgi:hypothetical protein